MHRAQNWSFPRTAGSETSCENLFSWRRVVGGVPDQVGGGEGRGASMASGRLSVSKNECVGVGAGASRERRRFPKRRVIGGALEC